MELRDLPSVDELARASDDPLAVDAARAVIARARERIRRGADPGDLTTLLHEELAAARRPALRRVLNATGVIVHTNLGRAPLAAAALERAIEATRGYSNLEYDLGEGRRGSRQDHVAAIVQRLTGAESAIVVNNNAGALLLALAALAEGRDVIVSRGELIEIGDGFRIPDVLTRSGARLVEVGTTNRTRAADYENAIDERTALLLRVHQSNFRVVGFAEQPSLEELATVARAPRAAARRRPRLGRTARHLRRADRTRLARRRGRPRLLQRRQAARRPAGRDRRGPRRSRRTPPAPPTPPCAAHRQAEPRRARRDTASLPRPRTGARRSSRAADAARARRDRARARGTSRGRGRRRGRGDRGACRRRRAAAARAAVVRVRRGGVARGAAARPRACRSSGSCGTAGCCSTAARSRTRSSTRSPPRSPHAADGRHRRPHRPRQDVARPRADGQGHRPAARGTRARHLDRPRLRAARAARRAAAVARRRAGARAVRAHDDRRRDRHRPVPARDRRAGGRATADTRASRGACGCSASSTESSR